MTKKILVKHAYIYIYIYKLEKRRGPVKEIWLREGEGGGGAGRMSSAVAFVVCLCFVIFNDLVVFR
jgi:hypothetical protein